MGPPTQSCYIPNSVPSQTALKSSKVRPKTLWIPSLNSPALRSYKDFSRVVFFLTTVYLIPFSWSTRFSGDLLGNWWLIILEFPLKSETDTLSVQFRPLPQTPLLPWGAWSCPTASLWAHGQMCPAFSLTWNFLSSGSHMRISFNYLKWCENSYPWE